jgi:hypothetical protein
MNPYTLNFPAGIGENQPQTCYSTQIDLKVSGYDFTLFAYQRKQT